MKREELLKRLPYYIPEAAKVRMIVDTDAKNEADDQFAIMHHLLTPMFTLCGIVAAHFEQKDGYRGTSMERSYQEIQKVLQLAGVEDVPAFRGCPMPLGGGAAPQSEGVDFIIREARKDSPQRLFIAVQGAMTNVAAALQKAPDIGERITVLWNGGGPYPEGRPEFNVMQDPEAVKILLESSATVWQITQDTYAKLEVSLAELAARVRPCGAIGKYLVEQLLEENLREFNPGFRLRTGENWCLGDNTTIAVLLEQEFRGQWSVRPAPILREDLTYQENPGGKPIRVYHDLDARLTLEDFFAKMQLAYRD